jgi:hypothetical protein
MLRRDPGQTERPGQVHLHIPATPPTARDPSGPPSVRCRHRLKRSSPACPERSIHTVFAYRLRYLTMSSTTTTQTQTRTRQNVLKDYELHHSAGSIRAASNSPAQTSRPQAAPLNPPNWDTTHRRVPPYRPVNTERDQSEVRVYTSGVERVFIGTMFTGVFINAVSSSV